MMTLSQVIQEFQHDDQVDAIHCMVWDDSYLLEHKISNSIGLLDLVWSILF